MADIKITDLPIASSIDGATDVLPIVNNALNETQQISRNVLLGITSQPIGATDSQIVSNKTVNNTNTIILKDTLFTLQDDGDITRQAKFQLSGITAGQTRTYTLPDASSILADISTAQTFTNKTLASPIITGGMNVTSGASTFGGSMTVTGVLTPSAGLSASSVTHTAIDMTTFPFEVTGLYSNFYSQPNQTGTVGNTYSFTVSLPRTVLGDETIMVFPTGSMWALPQFVSNTSTQFTFNLNCVVSSALMTSRWSAIYYKIH